MTDTTTTQAPAQANTNAEASTPAAQVPPVATGAPPAQPGQQQAQPPAGQQAEASKAPVQTEQAKPTGEAAKAPETLLGGTELTLKVPEGTHIDDGRMQGFKTIAKDLKLNQEAAQKLVDWYAREEVTRAEQARNTAVSRWNDEVKADPELGGQNYEQTVRIANQAFRTFVPPALREEFVRNGAASHPDIVRTFYAIGKLLQEDQAAGTLQAAPPSAKAKKSWESFYTTPPTKG